MIVCLCALARGQEVKTYTYPDGGHQSSKPAHLFILSGQSNMARLDPAVSFTPTVAAHFGQDDVIVVKLAKGSQPISQWDREWLSAQGTRMSDQGALYEQLISLVRSATEGRKVLSVTLAWMQGENDANRNQVSVYRGALDRLQSQLVEDLSHEDVNLVIGRLSDAKSNEGNPRRESWLAMRALQQEYSESSDSRAWVNTDDLNNMTDRETGEPRNDVHYTQDGYRTFGQRLAEAAIALVDAEQ